MSRLLWIAFGFIAVAIGAIGIIVPGLPTTVFFIVAAWSFSKSSPRFEQWVLNLPRVGGLVRDHRAGLGMPRRTKTTALAMMWTAIVASGAAMRDRIWIAAAIAALGMAGTAYIVWRVPTRPPADTQ